MQSTRKTYAPRRSMKERDANCESRAVFRKQFYKTELCRFYRSGCAKGENCCYAHGEQDLQTAPDLNKTSLCQAWIERRCPLASEACQFAHGWGDMHVTQAFVEYGSRQSKKEGGKAQSISADDIADAASGEAKDMPRLPSRTSRVPKRSARRSTYSAKEREMAEDDGSESTGGSSLGDSQSTAEQALEKPPASSLGAPAAERQPNVQVAQAAGPAFEVAIVLQPWGMPSQVPLLPLQLAAVGMAQPGPAQQLPENRALEMLLRQAMPDHYED